MSCSSAKVLESETANQWSWTSNAISALRIGRTDAQFFTPKCMHPIVYRFSLDPMEIRWLQVKSSNSIATQIHAFAKNSFAEAENTNTKELSRC